jgi:hypothetical protein
VGGNLGALGGSGRESKLDHISRKPVAPEKLLAFSSVRLTFLDFNRSPCPS